MFQKAFVAVWAACVLVVAPCAASAATTDVVLYATDAAALHGNWARVADPTAAGGHLMASVNKGWAATAHALAAPRDYFELTFTAPANTPHHIWLRLRAGANSTYNDSVYAQFSDAVSSKGAAVYAIGTTSGLAVDLQSCSGCALAGWGWMDGAYGMTQSTTLTFKTSGSHTLRIQTREDGVSLDQVVLSPASWLTTAPGQTMNDATIVPKPGPPVLSTPFTGTPAAVPGTIQAEDFDNGGEGIAYHDTTPGNSGGVYRQTDVDIEPATDGLYDVGWTAPSEWLNYTVNVASAGSYLLEARVASNGQGGTFHVEFAGADKTGALTFPNTGGWQNWTTVSQTVSLAAGRQMMKLSFDTSGASNGGNITWLRFTPSASAAPYSGTPIPLPGPIRPENFDNGGEGVAYHDTTSGNAGGQYRQTDVDIESSSLGGYDVGWMADGEWMNYTVNVTASGDYVVQFQVASAYATGQIHATTGSATTATLAVPNTGGWQTWTTISVPVTLTAGRQVLKVVTDAGGFNLAGITVLAAAPPPPPGVITVNAGGDLQSALDLAQPGDTIMLQAGATFSGNFVLPVKTGATYITIRSSAPDSALPLSTARINPSYAAQLPKIQSGNGMQAMVTAPGAHHYRLLDLEFLASYQGNGDILDLGDGSSAQNTLASVPHDLIIDRVYIHGDVTYGQKRGIGLNSASTSVINSYIADIKAVGMDSQAICGWNGPGPFTIVNNYLEAAGENVLFGGADPAIPNLVPSDITFTQNYLSKPMTWRTENWVVKNLLELKNAQRVVIDGNVLENVWPSGQTGYAVVITPRNQDGTAPWSVVQQVQFTNNVVRHVASVFQLLGTDDNFPSQQTNHILVRNNLFEDVSSAKYGGSGFWLLIMGSALATFDHNTVFNDGDSTIMADSAQATGLVITNNIMADNLYGIMGSNASPGNGTITAYFPGVQIRDDVFAGADPSIFPAGNYYPATMSSVGFVNLAGGNYRLAATSIYRGTATDGLDVGCDINALNAAAHTTY
jgi:hypothetical protein